MSKSSGFNYGWVVVGAGALMTCVGFGAMLSLAVFLQPISEAMGWSRAGVSAAATLDFLCMGSRRSSGARCPTGSAPASWCLSAALLLGLGLVAASQATSLWQFQLLFGILIGVAAGSLLCADDGGGERLDRTPSQPRRRAGVGRHGRGAADGGAVRELADRGL